MTLWKASALALLAMCPGGLAGAEDEASTVFARDVAPIFAEHCVRCHGPEKQKGGLRLDAKAHAMHGGDDGAVIAPGKSAESRLVHLIEGRDAEKVMPPKDPRLSSAQIATLRRWIDEGAAWPDDGIIARSKHWSLQSRAQLRLTISFPPNLRRKGSRFRRRQTVRPCCAASPSTSPACRRHRRRWTRSSPTNRRARTRR
jgi:mono/diheme cytochrome c family protein